MPIIAAIDSSPMASRVLTVAIDQARKSDTALHVVHVFHPPTALYAMAGSYSFEEETLAEAEHRVVWDAVEPQLETCDIEWYREDLKGYPATVITEYSRTVGAELVVIGTRGRGGFSSMVLGSTSQGVLQEAACNVLIVKPPVES